MPYKYINGKWTYVAENPSENNSNNGNVTKPPEPPIKPNPQPPWDNKPTTNTKPNSDKKYIEYEETTLTGSGTLEMPIVNLQAKKTVEIKGVGKYLSGRYFVDKVTHTFSTNGYEQTLEVSKNGFGDTVKPATEVPQAENKPNTTPNPVTPPTQKDGYVLINKWGTVTPRIGLNCRVGNSTKHKIIGAMTKGTRVFCIGKKDGWYDHKYKNQTAWSHGDYIELDK